MYDIADVDDSERYYLPESQVAILDLAESSRKLTKGYIDMKRGASDHAYNVSSLRGGSARSIS
jgi:hypothetical protein